MAKKLIRLTGIESFREKLPRYFSKKVNIVFSNNSVILVKVIDLKDDTLIASNMRLKRVKLDLDTISEIIIDIDA